MSLALKEKHQYYENRTGVKIKFEEFSQPKILINFHEGYIGTVLREYNSQLRIYDHVEIYGCMFFFSRLTDNEISNGPVVYEDLKGTVNCF